MKKTFWQRGLSLFASKHLAALTLVFLGLPCLLPAQILQHRYSFVNNANDSVGTANGTLIAPSAGKPAATINNGLILPGVGSGSSLSGYVQLPSGIVNGDYSVTVECWVKENVGREWAEIWDFGSSTTGLNFALIPDSNIPNLEVAFNNAGNNDIYTAASAVMATGSKQYVVITYNNSTLTGNLYTNGVLAGTTAYPNTSYSPGGFGSTTYDYLGNDVYGDEQFDGTIYELRIWSGVISPLYLAASTVAGSSVLVTNLNPTSISIGVATNMVGNGTQQAIVAVNLPQTGTTNVPATSTATNWVSGNTNVLTVNSSGLITAVSGGATTVSATVNGLTGTSSNITVALTSPVIDTQPASLTVSLGNTAVFTVGAVGGNLGYQWSFGAMQINGATNAVLTLTNVTPASAGSYSVLVTNALGSTNSAAAILAVNVPEIYVNTSQALHQVSPYLTGACLEDVNHEVYGGIYSQMIFGESFQEPAASSPAGVVSDMWIPISTGSVSGECLIETTNAFVGTQSQSITFTSGSGGFGIANQGLNQWGMSFIGGQPYEGHLDVLAAPSTVIWVALESANGTTVYAQQSLTVTSNGWQQLAFSLTPSASGSGGRFSIKLEQPGSVTVGYAFLQPGSWGQFQGLPVRNDVAQGLINQGITVLRYGGSMVNASGYRWQNMIGPRDLRPPYAGTWYPYSSDGWGIFDFLNFCEAAGFLGIPAVNMGETPESMAEFIEYANGSTNSTWGAQRLADGHPDPYNLQYLELGNEETVNQNYYTNFAAMAEAIWAEDPNITLVVGDFSYSAVISNPFNFSGAASGITTLAAQQQIIQLAQQYNREVWFDVHVWTPGPTPDSSLAGMFSYYNALQQIEPGANFKVSVFELNANVHTQSRALANALAINAVERDGRLPVVTSANCLQPDGENNNGWDQGLLFLNQSQVWLQPPGYLTQMYSQSYQPVQVWSGIVDPNFDLDVSAACSTDGSTLVLRVVNLNSANETAVINLAGFVPTNPLAMVEEITGGLTATNTAADPGFLIPVNLNWQPGFTNMTADFAFASNSVTTITIQGESAPPPPATLTHRYSFQGATGSTIITDSVGGQNGTFSGSAGGLDGNGNLVLDGVNEYVNLGPNLIAGYTNVSVESWVSVSTSDATHARLFDFGDTDSSGNGDYGMDFVPVSGSSSWFEVFDIDPGYEDPQQILGTSLAGAGEVYVAVVYDPQLGYAAVYTNGILAASGAINIPFTSLVDAHDYIGKSGYNADPYLTATVSEFRVYRGDLSPAQVAEDYAAGPATLPPSHPILSISLSGNSLILSWSVYAAGYNVQMTTNLANGASWGPPPGASAPVPTNGVYQIVLPISGQTAFYRLVQ